MFGPYRLTRLLGRGGMGEVYEAEDTVKGRTVALKLLPEALSHDPVFRKRLQREARAAGRLQEPHVVPIHNYGEIDGHLYVDMRLIDGIDLRSALVRSGPMPPARAVEVVRQIAAALDAAHAAGVLHRDVKPENILVTADDFAYLVDFGIASAASEQSLTDQGTTIGTFAYMAPERFGGGPVTHRADIYALACVLHQCLTGAQPYPADSVSTLITAHLMEPPPAPSRLRPDIPAEFDAVVARGMAKSADDRYASAGELARAAEAALGDRAAASAQADTMPASAFRSPAPAGKFTGRTAAVIGAVAAVVLVVVGGAAVWLTNRSGEATGMSATQTITRTVFSPPAELPEADANLPQADRQLLEAVVRPDSCVPDKDRIANAVAAVTCGPTSPSSGQQTAYFALFADADDLDRAFDDVIADDELTACPNSDDSPTNWDYEDTPDEVAGSLACGTYEGFADIVWTRNADLLLGTAKGRHLDRLYDWWLDNA
ncbi:serine/threonine protein kinase [Mycolicibacterium sp. S2-37]|uniref:serine/threonine-protein kinase n=1 Tax=Mycolicibacterium sp. S2-37 TaxID=2810297 RepID=UPI001A94F4A4|nr:serine/threonine-protein kinase [Mycolicibacterium sp. S2-37]MBO0678187.1 serine/threonine protein kinase [Mycolicibacterium sp. S2-37]